jgi:hypothetical protein
MINLKRISVFIVLTLAFVLYAALGCSKQNKPAEVIKVGEHGILHKGMKTVEHPVTPSPAEAKKKEVAERLDKAKLLYTGKVVVDSDPKMLVPIDAVAKFAGKDYVIAKTPPTVEFCVVPVEPLWLGESPVKTKSQISNEPGPWSNWCQSNFDTRTGKFYSAIGDHGKYDAHILLVEYDPATKAVRCLPEVNKVLGRTMNQFSEGKIHGWLDFYQSKDLKSPSLWYCTYWAKYNEPDEEDYATGYDGGHIMSYDVLTGDIVDYGVPLKRASWPYHRVDTKRGIMYAVGMFGEFLAWDINKQETKWAGYLPYLPNVMGWWERAILIDDATGMVYTSNRAQKYDPELHFVKYDPFKNRFSLLNCHMPQENLDSTRGGKAGGYTQLRAETRERGPDGLFWCISYSGKLFTFDPVKEEIVDKGYNWVGIQKYTASMDRSPKGRYIYYLPGAHGHGYSDGSPVVQYDTQTGTRKVLAFMFPYYYDKYGYTPGGTFSIKLDDKGERLFVLWNGAFVEYDPTKNSDTFGQCSAMVINIPDSERQE